MKGYKHLTQKQKDDILRVYAEIKSVPVTAERLGINHQRVRYFLKKNNIPLTRYPNSACYRNQELVTKLAQSGHSYSEIARQVGTNHHRVKEFLDRLNIEHPGHKQTGSNNPNWKGGRMIDKDSYVLIHNPNHPFATRHGYVREHRLVIEKAIGRYLSSKEVVHHLDDDHQNNALDNLQLYSSNADHLAETLKGKIPNWTPEGQARILAGVRRKRGPRQKPNHG